MPHSRSAMPRTAASMLLVSLALELLCVAPPPAAESAPRAMRRIQHVIIIYMENWSFDGLYGTFPGANGIANAGAAVRQVDKLGNPYATLLPDDADGIPGTLPVLPFWLEPYVPDTQTSQGDPSHEFYAEQYQIDGGRMDQFVAWGGTGALVMSFYDARQIVLGMFAEQYTLCDHYFHSAFGGSFLNHMWLLGARTPVWRDAPPSERPKADPVTGKLINGVVTPDGYMVNTPPDPTPQGPVPLQTYPIIGDRLTERHIQWAWYGRYSGMVLPYFARYAPGTPGDAHIQESDQDFVAALKLPGLPAVCFVRPSGFTEHPDFDPVLPSEQHAAELIQAVQNSGYWSDSVIFLTYDENGGRWDHVAPPRVDRFGPGTRVPCLIISPFVKRGFVDHHPYETVSILKFIEQRFNLRPLTRRDARARAFVAPFE